MKILILPGLDGTGRLLKDFAHELGAEHDVEIVSYPVELTSYADIGVWLERRLPPDDYAIVAESFSGPLAIKIASQKPKALKALVLVASFARSPRKISPSLVKALNLLPYFPSFCMWASLPLVIGNARTPEFLAAYRATLREITLPMLVGRLHAVSRVDVRNILPNIDVPISYIRATEDRLVPASISSDFGPYCDQFHQIDAPHFILQAKPQEAADLVLKLL
jgi:pimeloyl-ACP methyl ester carboxylesterase